MDPLEPRLNCRLENKIQIIFGFQSVSPFYVALKINLGNKKTCRDYYMVDVVANHCSFVIH